MIFNYNSKDLKTLTRNQMFNLLEDLKYIKSEILDEEFKRDGLLIDAKRFH
tara:strand:+ start:7119 stop:7271 length:153 start_codon:yes stop_codon:yes gene_type:complete